MLIRTCVMAASAVVLAAAGAENIFPNHSFETWNEQLNLPTQAKWRWNLPAQKKQDAFAIFGRSQDVRHSGGYALHLKDAARDKTNHKVGFMLFENDIRKYGLAGKKLRFSCWVKQMHASKPKSVGIAVMALAKSGKKWGADAIDSKGETDWVELKTTLDLPLDVNLIFAFFNCADGWFNDAEAYFDDVLITVEPEAESATPPSGENAKAKPQQYGKELLSLFPVPRSWQMLCFGGFPGTPFSRPGVPLSFFLKKATKPYGGFTLSTEFLNREYALSDFSADALSLIVIMDRDTPIQCQGAADKPISLKHGEKIGENRYLYRFPLQKKADGRQWTLNSICLQFPNSLPPGKVTFEKIAIFSKEKFPVRYADYPDIDDYVAKYQKATRVTDDPRPRPEIRNGTWYIDGKPEYYLGVWLYSRKYTDWHAGANPLKIDHIGYTDPPGKKVFEAMGFNSSQISAAHSLPGQILNGQPVPSNYRKRETQSQEFFSEFAGIPMVIDFAFGFENVIKNDNPELYRKMIQKNPHWHAFIPFCPESPEGQRYYHDFFRYGTLDAIQKGLNIFLYELFNESSYDCMCEYNKRDFVTRMEKKYGSMEAANRQWNTNFPSFDAVAGIDDYRRFPALWPDWCKFSAVRYAEILKKYSDLIRTVDGRKNVYFTEMAAGTPPSWTGMDYRLIADALDALAIEGGWRYGFATDYKAKTGEEAVVATGGSAHWFNCDFFQAAAKGKKPIVNDEHYCYRAEYGIRVPSKKEDMITSLWMELLHGGSGNFTYVWDKRSFDWKTFEEAKKNVLKPSYKSSSLLNPYNWPVSELDAFQIFQKELAPYKERILPFPRVKPARIAVLFSYPSLRMSPLRRDQYRKNFEARYTSLLHAFYPAKIIFEEDIDALTDEVRAIVIPRAAFCPPEAVAALNRFAARGGKLIAESGSLQSDEYGKPLPKPDSILWATGEKEIQTALESAKIHRYGTLEAVDPWGDIRQGDLQICDRGDFKLIFAVAMGHPFARLVTLKLDLENDSGNYYLYDVVKREMILPKNGKTWNAAMLRDGFPVLLPSQTRVLFTLTTEKPINATPVSYAAMQQRMRNALPDIQAERNAADEKLDQIRVAARAAREYSDVDPTRCHPIDLRAKANTGFRDEIAGDKKGGWFDQGAKDFSAMPLGKQVFSRVPFDIIDPAQNEDRSAIVLKSSHSMHRPEKITGIAVGRKASRLYFLHTMGWGASGTVLTYIIHYANGASSEFPVVSGQHIAGWVGASPLAQAKIAVEISNADDAIAMYCTRWINPHPDWEIAAIDVVSANTSGIPAVAAITLEE